MRALDTLTTDTLTGTPTNTKSGNAQPVSILVPVDSSRSAFNSLEYARNLAKVRNASIHIFYISDANELPESDNPIVVGRMLDRFDSKAASCVESLKEMIEESGVTVLSAEARIGNVEVLLQKRVECLRPNMIVIGRDTFGKHILSSLMRWATCPVLIVPETSAQRLPSSIVLSSDPSSLKKDTLDSLFRILGSATREFNMLTIITGRKFAAVRLEGYFSTQRCNIRVNYCQQGDVHVLQAVDTFVQANEADLLCYIERERPFLRRIFNRQVSKEFVYRVNIPVLVMSKRE